MAAADSSQFTRGRLLGVAACAVGGALLASCGGAGPDLGTVAPLGFARLSRIVSGLDDLPSAQVNEYLAALDAAGLEMSPTEFMQQAGYLSGYDLSGYTGGGGPTTLEDLKALPLMREPGATACVQAIAAAWWSGIVPTADGGQKVLQYVDAGIWKSVLPYARPQTVCLGETGAWSKPGTPVTA